jgi:hypothetical protein
MDKVQPNNYPNFKTVASTLVDTHAGGKYAIAQIQERCSKSSPFFD